MNDFTRRVLRGDVRALARAATAIENLDSGAQEMLRDLAPFGGNARVVGITGPPGAGKSTLVDALATAIRQQDKSLAILAVDPSSGLTGGAILGDRIRMQQHHADPAVFIRSMATRGNPGGIARATASLVRLMDAAGKQYVLVETVGVGQAEIEIAALAQVTVVVLVPGMGDDVQAIKAGIMEIADIFVINKSDQPGADRVERELQAMLSLTNGRTPAIVKTVATTGEGVDQLLAAIARFTPESKPSHTAGIVVDRIAVVAPHLGNMQRAFYALGLEFANIANLKLEAVCSIPLGGTRIDIIHPLPGSPYEEFLRECGPGVHHVSLRVPNLNAAIQALREEGVRLLSGPRPRDDGRLAVLVHPEFAFGVLLELIEEDNGGHAPSGPPDHPGEPN